MDDFQLTPQQEVQLDKYLANVYHNGYQAMRELGERFGEFTTIMQQGGYTKKDDQIMILGFFFEENPNEAVDIISIAVFERFFLKFQSKKTRK